MKSLVRMRVWWQNIDDDIAKKVRSRSSCQLQQSSPATFNSPWPKATRVWERVHIDFAGPCYGKIFMIVTDTCLAPRVLKRQVPFFHATVFRLHWYQITRQVLQALSLPSSCVKTGYSFYTHRHIIRIQTAWQNAQYARCKEQIKKISSSKESLNLLLTNFLYHYRGTSHSVTGTSPARLFLGRELRNMLDLLKPTSLTDHKEKSKPTVGPRKYNVEDAALVRDYANPDRPVGVQGVILKCSRPLFIL